MSPIIFEADGRRIAISQKSDGDMSGRGRKKTWSNMMVFFRSNFETKNRLIATRVCHGRTIKEVDRNSGALALDIDGLITQDPGVTLAINYADCFPIAVWDTISGITMVLHVSFQTAAAEIVSLGIEKMVALGASPKNILALIGPGICERCYDYGSEAPEKIDSNFHDYLDPFGIDGKFRVDIAGIISQQLLRHDLFLGNIIHSRLCTFERKNLFSARREKPPSLRELQSGVLMIGHS